MYLWETWQILSGIRNIPGGHELIERGQYSKSCLLHQSGFCLTSSITIYILLILNGIISCNISETYKRYWLTFVSRKLFWWIKYKIYLIGYQKNHLSLQKGKGCKEFWPLLENKAWLHFQHLVVCIPESINMLYILFHYYIIYLFIYHSIFFGKQRLDAFPASGGACSRIHQCNKSGCIENW